MYWDLSRSWCIVSFSSNPLRQALVFPFRTLFKVTAACEWWAGIWAQAASAQNLRALLAHPAFSKLEAWFFVFVVFFLISEVSICRLNLTLIEFCLKTQRVDFNQWAHFHCRVELQNLPQELFAADPTTVSQGLKDEVLYKCRKCR